MKKSQNMLVWLCKMVLTQRFLHIFLRLVKGTTKLTSAVDWLESLIGLGVLLLVVSHLFAVPVLVLWVELETK
jgi:hypothetical protein